MGDIHPVFRNITQERWPQFWDNSFLSASKIQASLDSLTKRNVSGLSPTELNAHKKLILSYQKARASAFKWYAEENCK